MDFTGEPLRSCHGDPELLLHIPFEGEVKIRAIAIIGGSPGNCPSHSKTVRLSAVLKTLLLEWYQAHSTALSREMCRYTNRDDLDFPTVQDLQPVQQFDLNHDARGILEYPVKCAAPPCCLTFAVWSYAEQH